MLELLRPLGATGTPSPGEEQAVIDQIMDWQKHPFLPHRVARMRLIAYQKFVLMKYLDNLIAWGDQLFGQNTIETINAATQLYIMASNLLGQRPQTIPSPGEAQAKSYADLRQSLDKFSNAIVEIENEFPFSQALAPVGGTAAGALGLGLSLYFCVPRNEQLLTYWDTVADRLHKIRHCMNIAGVVQSLPLFEPPIDPGLLVAAAAAGVDLGSVLGDVNAPLPYYRFSVMIQKAFELCGELKSLGAAVLGALEKKDAEALTVIRARHETDVLTAARLVKQQQVDEANASITALEYTRKTAVERWKHYQEMLGVSSPADPAADQPIPETAPSGIFQLQDSSAGAKYLSYEQADLDNSAAASDKQAQSSGYETTANFLSLVPQLAASIRPMGVGASLSFGGSHLAASVSAYARYLQSEAGKNTYQASRNVKLASFVLRERDWVLQTNQAAREIEQIDKQLAAARIRAAIAAQELTNHDKQIAQAQEIQEFLKDKYTNTDLYGWMLGQLATVYFQNYQLAYDLAKRAERCFRFERGLNDTNFIQFGYWDSLYKGLLTGDQLQLALKRMERAYMEQNQREFEITKSISLLQLDPLALMQLKETETSSCTFELPEVLFDLDFPGHYFRRIKSVSLSIPCVAGPYTGVNCTLRLTANSTRISPLAGAAYNRKDENDDDPRFVQFATPIQAVATSQAQNDSGVFELNFHDDRYLPFEGAGVISSWRLELPAKWHPFDYNTISDVVMHLRYTAREDNGLRDPANTALRDALEAIKLAEIHTGLVRLFSARHEFAADWYHFRNPEAPAGTQTLILPLGEERFPFVFRGQLNKMTRIELYVKVKSDVVGEYQSQLSLQLALDSNPTPDPLPVSHWNNVWLRASTTDAAQFGPRQLTAWLQTDLTHKAPVDPDAIEDLFVLCYYTLKK